MHRKGGEIEVDKPALKSHKQKLARSFDPSKYPPVHLVNLVTWIDHEVAQVLSAIPTDAFL
ncbi:MAG: hypothetical protein QOJ56_6193 [Mycobacterium sp.]|jgi:hypothetical protein|nr:hypothetical protein [Mycobacterium sp.]